jgi:hypothetical protein
MSATIVESAPAAAAAEVAAMPQGMRKNGMRLPHDLEPLLYEC